MIEFSAWRTIMTAPFKAWIMYWYLPMDLSYHQCPVMTLANQTPFWDETIPAEAPALAGFRGLMFQVAVGNVEHPRLHHQDTTKIRATNVTGITSAVSAEVLHCGCSHRWGFQSVWLAQSKIGARVVLGCAQIISIPDYADAEYKHI